MKIGFIGLGNMAGTICQGLIKSDFIDSSEVYGYDINSQQLMMFEQDFVIHVCSSEQEVVKNCDYLVMGVKPNVVESVISNLQNNYLKKGISLSCKCEEGTCMLEPDLVRSLVINLIDNGRKAMTNGGHIYVQTTMTDKGCIIQVKDDGRGMPKDAIAHITEAFYRVDKSRSRQQGGAGLGLALCENIIKLHNGNINFKSKENVGTIVNVELKGGRE